MVPVRGPLTMCTDMSWLLSLLNSNFLPQLYQWTCWFTLCFLPQFTSNKTAFVVQISEVFDEEVSKETQCPRLASCDCIQQGPKCLWIEVLQHSWQWCRGGRLRFWNICHQMLFLLWHSVEVNAVLQFCFRNLVVRYWYYWTRFMVFNSCLTNCRWLIKFSCSKLVSRSWLESTNLLSSSNWNHQSNGNK